MRRILFSILASCVVLAVAPIAASARHEAHHGQHHKRHHRHHARTRHDSRGGSTGAKGSGSTGAKGSDDGDDPGGTEMAGTVDSFTPDATGGVLTIKLTDGSTVTGEVTGDTELKCEAPSGTVMTGDDHGRGGDGSGDGGSGDDSGGGDDTGDGGDDGGAMCTTAALTPGTVVNDAELHASSVGAIWEEVDLATSSS